MQIAINRYAERASSLFTDYAVMGRRKYTQFCSMLKNLFYSYRGPRAFNLRFFWFGSSSMISYQLSVISYQVSGVRCQVSGVSA